MLWILIESINQSNYNIFCVGVTNARSADTHKGALKADRHIKELEFTTDENRKNIDRMTELVEKVQGKIRK